MPRRPPVVLTIAGFDPSSGAGATADLKTIAAHGCYGMACLTALTVQSRRGVHTVQAVPPRLVEATLRELAHDVRFDGVKIGMLATSPVVGAVARFLKRVKPPNVVLDPVLRASSGAELLDGEGRLMLAKRLLPLATVVTPNLEEASVLSGSRVKSLAEMKRAAARLHRLGARNVVITGGHLKRPVDLLSMTTRLGPIQVEFAGRRVRTSANHGTGCAFSSALACNLALGRSLPDAVRRAKQYVTGAMANPCALAGVRALNHFYAVERQLRVRRKAGRTRGKRRSAIRRR